MRVMIVGWLVVFSAPAVFGLFVAPGWALVTLDPVAVTSKHNALVAEKHAPNVVAKSKTQHTISKSLIAKDWKKAGFPRKAAYENAKSIGLTRYAAYRLLRDKAAIATYCDWLDRSWSITKRADKKFGKYPTGKREAKKDGWERKQQDKLNLRKQKKLGVNFVESQLLAKHGSWRVHCSAKKVGWLAVELQNAEAVTDKEAAIIAEAIEVHYMLRLENGRGRYFNNRKYSVSSCERKKVGKLHVVGCRLMAFGKRSRFDFFVAARTKDGKLAAASIERNRHLSEFGTRKIYSVNDDLVYLARIAAPRFDRTHPSFRLADIKAAFSYR